MRYIIWDFDDTLAMRDGRWTGAMLTALDGSIQDHGVTSDDLRPHIQTGFPWHTPDLYHPHLSNAEAWWKELAPVFARAFVAAGITDDIAEEASHRVRHAYIDPNGWRLFDDTLPTLEALSNHGWRHVILSNHVPELGQLVECLGLSPHIAAVFNSAELGYEKPHTEAFRAVVEFIGEAEAVWMVGDSFNADVIGARNAAIPAILVRREHPDAERYCATLEDVVALLAR